MSLKYFCRFEFIVCLVLYLSTIRFTSAISLFVNAFPLVEDVLNMVDKVYHSGNILQKIFYTPGIAICYAGAYLEKYCLTFLFAIALTMGIIS